MHVHYLAVAVALGDSARSGAATYKWRVTLRERACVRACARDCIVQPTRRAPNLTYARTRLRLRWDFNIYIAAMRFTTRLGALWDCDWSWAAGLQLSLKVRR